LRYGYLHIFQLSGKKSVKTLTTYLKTGALYIDDYENNDFKQVITNEVDEKDDEGY